VAYLIWEQAAEELPNCPEESRVGTFLDAWSLRAYTDVYKKGPRGETLWAGPCDHTTSFCWRWTLRYLRLAGKDSDLSIA
jgi:hypothetical protein